MISSLLLSHLGGFVADRWLTDGPTFSVRNPATGEELARLPNMGGPHTTAAVEAAASAVGAEPDPAQRREWLLTIADLLDKNRPELARIITLENGKPLKESSAEVDYAAGFFRYFARIIDHLRPRTLPDLVRDCRWTVYQRPTGVVGLITPWNFPLAMLAKKLSAALAAGCGIVARPASKTPLTTVALWHLLQTLRLPTGTANLVLGDPEPIARILLTDPRVRLISFTGSTEVGQQLIAGSAIGVKRLALELGGSAPYLVFADADITAAADALIANKFRAGGQTCVCANRIYVEESIADGFADAVAERVARLKIGDGMFDGTDVGPMIDRHGFDKVARHVADALAQGARRLVGSDPPAPPPGDCACFYPPTVFAGVTDGMLVTREETFGPIVPISAFQAETDAVRFANATPYGLAAYLFTADTARAQRLIPQLHFGHVGLNTGAGPAPHAPFGGMKMSGFGREGGIEGLLEYCEPQTIAAGE